eukprot:CAMPEP_0170503546 /NCGR_PEP_ID=MMETSP0208-20121228/45144_1 /TAXON_ID=197538 /ORGANISM="Strombidium inclinatum, Strain S3" /LENGTH=37 /DNA_ID= /DNA_START= /DNA_END= /DNA_ORIENTATION=
MGLFEDFMPIAEVFTSVRKKPPPPPTLGESTRPGKVD